MPYALESMLRIREMREDRASKELVAARHARELAANELTARRDSLQKYNTTKEERRDKVFDTILHRPVPREEIDAVNSAIAQIDEEGILLANGVQRAQEDLEDKTKEADKAHGRYIVSVKEHAKVTQHKAIWAEEERKLQELQEDAEMEEFTGRKLTNDDDDSID
ncbi:MAG: YscO family type III secretion system apparatus protein [Victivallales bacterium]|nr:YscO family type III secretion system apparatus protein [Victivallales bacterium]